MMLPEEEEETARSKPQKDPLNQSAQSAQRPHDGRDSSRGSGHYSSSNRDRAGRNDDYYHRSNRAADRDRSHRDRDRDGDRNCRDRNSGSSRYREHFRDREDRRDRRDRRSRTPERGGARKHSSRSRSKESRSRDSRDYRDSHRSPRDERSHGGSSSHEVQRERLTHDRLEEEIEQELANLRRQHDLKEALKKEQAKRLRKDSRNVPHGSSSKATRPKPLMPAVLKKHKPDFIPLDGGIGVQSAAVYVPEIQTEEERIEFQRKMQEKLQQHLAAEGKLYPPPSKPSREPPVQSNVSCFANDGSFLEMFKQLQQQHVIPEVGGTSSTLPVVAPLVGSTGSSGPGPVKQIISPTAGGVGGISKMVVVPQSQTTFKIGAPVGAMATTKSGPQSKPSTIEKEPPPPPLPVFGRRRGGKILKTGLVKKVRPVEESATETPNDPWALYLQEVKKYKSASCDADSKTRPLVK